MKIDEAVTAMRSIADALSAIFHRMQLVLLLKNRQIAEQKCANLPNEKGNTLIYNWISGLLF